MGNRAPVLAFFVVVCSAIACGPPARPAPDAAPTECEPGAIESCYSGIAITAGVGACHAGARTCSADGAWTGCTGEVVPVAEACGDAIDNDCNGAIDDNVDADHDGFTSCGGDCCDNAGLCSEPALVNPGAFDFAGDTFDNDCNGLADDTPLLCDQSIASNTASALDYARAIDICQGVVGAKLTLADGSGTPDPEGRAIRQHFGANVLPQGGVRLAILSTGGAAAKSDSSPSFHPWVSYTHAGINTSPFPADFLAANGGVLPNAPGCPNPAGSTANDSEMLTLRLRVPTNARSFELSVNFFSAEFPEWTCTSFNDFFVVLLDSTYAGEPANPADKNLAFFDGASSTHVPVGVNLAHGNTGLFTQCVNGATGCSGTTGTISTCTSTTLLAGTGFDDPNPGACDSNSLQGGATGWLVTRGNVVPGEVITLRIAIWDTSDHAWDSLAVIDGFRWSGDPVEPGTVILKTQR